MEDCGVKRPPQSLCVKTGFRRTRHLTIAPFSATTVAVVYQSFVLRPRSLYCCVCFALSSLLIFNASSVVAQESLAKSPDTTTAYASATKSSAANATGASAAAANKLQAMRRSELASRTSELASRTPAGAVNDDSGAAEPTLAEPSLSLRDALFEELARDAEQFQRQYGIVKRVVRLVSPTVVHIDAYSGTNSDEAGSGIIIKMNDSFFVLTNRHVVDTPLLEGIKIKTDDGELLQPVKKWADPATDVAVIQVASKDLLPTRVGDSDKVEIGDFVLAVGSPFGLSHSVSYGIISAKGRWDLAIGEASEEAVRFQDFLQTDAAINPGNSGGPLLNLKGEVVGINTAIASNSGGNEGIGFSIPINLALNVARQLVKSGAVSTAYLGVRLDHDFDEKLSRNRTLASQLGLSRARGAFVKSVTKGSPADQARLEAGDIVVEFNGVRVEDDDHLINLVSLTPLNEVVSVNIVRGRREYFVHVRVGRRRDFEPVE